MNLTEIFLSGLTHILVILSWAILLIGLLQNIIYIIQLPCAWLELKQYSQFEDVESTWQLLISQMAIPISVLVPAYNEEATIVENTRSLLALEYPNFEVTIINDGSSDQTLQELITAFSLKPISRAHELRLQHAPVKQLYSSPFFPHLTVIDKENGKGKADAINAGINFSRELLFCIIDADSLLEPQSLLQAVRPFMEDPKHMVAVGGTVRISNGCIINGGRVRKIGLPKKLLPLIQYIEYIRAFLMARLAWSRWKVLTIISGAFGIFQREAVIKVGGFSHNTVGEDLEIILKLHKELRRSQFKYAMRYVPEPVCWTQAPDDLHTLGIQRSRWQRGMLEGFFKHRDMLLNPQYGRIGILGFSHILLIDVLGPLAELSGLILIPLLWIFGILNLHFFLAYVALFFIFGIFISICSLILEEIELYRLPKVSNLIWLAFASIIENFGYRQLSNFWRIRGWWQFIRRKTGWGTMVRKRY